MVEVRHVLNEHATQMPLVQDQQVIQTVISDRSQPPLRDGVGLGRYERSADRCDPQVADPAVEGLSRSCTRKRGGSRANRKPQ